MTLPSVLITIHSVFRLSSFLFLFMSVIALTGCGDDHHHSSSEPSSEPTTVFATFAAPTTAQDIEAWLADFPVRVSRLRSQILTAQSPAWDSELIPLYELFIALSEAGKYNTLLMDRSPDPAVRMLAYAGYAQIPQLRLGLVMDSELKAAVETALHSLVATTTWQQHVTEYLTNEFTRQYSAEQQRVIMQAEADLTDVSLAYYSNVNSKSAVATFAAEDFACLPEATRTQIPTDSTGDFIFDANNRSLYSTLARSCLDETTREQLHAVFRSKAAAENSQLWPTILQQRLTYAELQGFEDFATMRLSHGMLQQPDDVRILLEQVKNITDPAFERLQQRFKDAQAREEGGAPETVFAWNRFRYYPEVKAEVLGSVPANPRTFTYPETIDRVLYLVGKIIGLRFEKIGLLENGWNPDVIEYLVYDRNSNAPVGTFLLDPFQVEGGNEVPNVQGLLPAKMLASGERQAPVVVMKLSVGKTHTGTTSLTGYEYYAFGHELGHALHFLLRSDQGETKSDFLEIPSTFGQKLVQQPQFFKAVLSPNPDEPLVELPGDFERYWNHDRGSPLLLCENMRNTLMISATSLDLTTWQGATTTDLAEVARDNLLKYYYPYSSHSDPFYDLMHFINPATDASYYMYVLADVVSADILSVFDDSPDSIFDQQLGAQYRYHLLENSATDSEASISNFLGREWNYDAFSDWFEEKTEAL